MRAGHSSLSLAFAAVRVLGPDPALAGRPTCGDAAARSAIRVTKPKLAPFGHPRLSSPGQGGRPGALLRRDRRRPARHGRDTSSAAGRPATSAGSSSSRSRTAGGLPARRPATSSACGRDGTSSEGDPADLPREGPELLPDRWVRPDAVRLERAQTSRSCTPGTRRVRPGPGPGPRLRAWTSSSRRNSARSRRSSREFADAEIAPHAAEWDRAHGFPQALLEPARGAGPARRLRARGPTAEPERTSSRTSSCSRNYRAPTRASASPWPCTPRPATLPLLAFGNDEQPRDASYRRSRAARRSARRALTEPGAGLGRRRAR